MKVDLYSGPQELQLISFYIRLKTKTCNYFPALVVLQMAAQVHYNGLDFVHETKAYND